MADAWHDRRRAIEDAALGFGIVGALGLVFRYLIGNPSMGGPLTPGTAATGQGPTAIERVRPLSRPTDITPLHPTTLVPGGYSLPPGTVLPPRAAQQASGAVGQAGAGRASAAPAVVGLGSAVAPLAPSASGLEILGARGGAAGGDIPCAAMYQTRAGDTLRGIARRFYGDDVASGEYYGAVLYQVNEGAIEAAAQASGFQSSGRGARLATNLWLCLPQLSELHLPVPG